MSDRIGVELEPSQVSLEAGGQGQVAIAIANGGTTVDQFAVSLEVLPEGWYSLTPQSVSLFPQDRGRALLELHPPRGAEARAETYPFRLVVASRQSPGETTVVEGTLTVHPFGALILALEPERARGRAARYRLLLRNPGNAPRHVMLSASDPEEALEFRDLPSQAVVVDAGAGAEVTTRVKPRQRQWAGPEKTYRIRIVAAPPGVEWEEAEALAVEGEFIYKPYLGAWPWAGWPRWLQRLLMVGLPLLALAVALLAGAAAGPGLTLPDWLGGGGSSQPPLANAP
ncbi:MAG TPA: hypothetical protein VJ256_06285, partial [Dehalococcoidia bacterium]|nr:hypothetical protein [Dehalococcoidia bacterium]